MLIEPKHKNIITVEGTDGTGKTSFVKELVSTLKRKGLTSNFFPIIESTAFGEIYKKQYISGLLNPALETTGMLYSCMSTLNMVHSDASRYYNYCVIDRSFTSFNVYQILTNEYSWIKDTYVKQILSNSDYTSLINVYLTVDTNVAFERMKARGRLDAIESRGPDYQKQLTKNYEKTFNMYPQLAPHFRIDTTNITTQQAVNMFIQNYLQPQANQK